MNNPKRFNQAWQELQQVYNKPGHDFIWNEKRGKEPQQDKEYGRLWCRACGREFAWRYRSSNLPNSAQCIPIDPPPTPPAWVKTCSNNSSLSVIQPYDQSSTNSAAKAAPRRRLVGKQNPDQASSLSQQPLPPGDLPRSGIDEYCVFGGRRRYAGCAPTSHLYFKDPKGPKAQEPPPSSFAGRYR